MSVPRMSGLQEEVSKSSADLDSCKKNKNDRQVTAVGRHQRSQPNLFQTAWRHQRPPCIVCRLETRKSKEASQRRSGGWLTATVVSRVWFRLLQLAGMLDISIVAHHGFTWSENIVGLVAYHSVDEQMPVYLSMRWMENINTGRLQVGGGFHVSTVAYGIRSQSCLSRLI
jgi:hypothetical protein